MAGNKERIRDIKAEMFDLQAQTDVLNRNYNMTLNPLKIKYKSLQEELAELEKSEKGSVKDDKK